MFRQNRVMCVAVMLLMTDGVFAQPTQHRDTPGARAGARSLTPALVKTGLYMISGGGCNSILRLSANGFILVDGKLPGTFQAILELAKKLSYSEQPIRILINTDYHQNHTGNNAKFLENGTAVVAHENVNKYIARRNLLGETFTAPSKTYQHELTIDLGGIQARLLHFGNAHTDGDTVVYFPNLKVAAVGDLFAASPDPDFAAGGSLVGWGPVLDEILKLDFDVAVPATGPTVSRADLEAFKTKIDTLVSRATQLVGKGVPKNRLMSQLKTDDLGWRFSFTGRQLDRFYSELAGWKQATAGF